MLPLTIMIAAVAYLPGVGGSTVAGRWAVLSIGAVAMLLRAPDRPLLGPAHAWGGALVLWAALSALWSVSPLDTASELWHWLVLSVLFMASSQYRDPELILSGVVIALSASLLVAMAQMLGQHPVMFVPNAEPSGLFLNRNVMGEVAACALVWAAAVTVTSEPRAWALIPVPLLLVLITGSRGALLACMFGGLYLLWSSGRRLWIAPIVLSFLVGALLITCFKDPDLQSVLARLDIWSLALGNLTLLGRGLETFGTLAPRYEFVHNDFIQLVFELGPGALLAAGLFRCALRAGHYSRAEGAALASLLGASLVSYPLHHPMGAALVAVLAGLSCGAADRARRTERLLGVCGAARAEYEWRDSSTDLLESRPRLSVVAS